MRVYRVAGVEVDKETLRRWIDEELALHEFILGQVKRYYDGTLRALGVEPERLAEEDPSTYYALLLELARSVYVSIQNRARSLARQRRG